MELDDLRGPFPKGFYPLLENAQLIVEGLDDLPITRMTENLTI